jgi:glycosyltransferase involved in cell wall biosynthesis
MNDQIYIISGIEPGKKGAGRFIKNFVEIIESKGIKPILIFNKTPENKIISYLRNTQISNQLKSVYYFFSNLITSRKDVMKQTVIIFHPQTIGLQRTLKLIENNNKVYLYVLDNFFFCYKSYNNIENELNSCTECLSAKTIDKAVINKCKSFPQPINHTSYSHFFSEIKHLSNKIEFLTQNENQTTLIKQHFGSNTNVRLTGMDTGELSVVPSYSSNDIIPRIDFLFHNTLHKEKGVLYFIELAKYLPQFSFCIPYSKNYTSKTLNIDSFSSNIVFIPCTWETGLYDLVKSAKIIICPSLWSAPVEGSFLKSLYFNGCVAVLKTSYSFVSEIPSNTLIELSENIAASVQTLSRIISDDIAINNYKKNSNNWIENFQKKNIELLNEFANSLV